MPRKSRRSAIKFGGSSRKRGSKPNVYVAPEVDEGNENTSQLPAQTPNIHADSTRTRRRQPRRLTAPMRTEIYTKYLKQELTKLGVLTLALSITLGILTFTLR